MAYGYQQYQFVLTRPQNSAQIIQCLTKKIALNLSGHKKFHRTFYDTFDWRLHNTHTSFYAEQLTRQYSLHSKNIITGDSLLLTHQGKVPRFAWDVTDVMFYRALSKKLNIRALLTVLETDVEQDIFELRNEENKIISKMMLENCQVKTCSIASKEQHQYFMISPLRGFNEQVEQLLPTIIRWLPVQSNIIDLQQNIIQRLAIEPFPYSPKITVTLSAEQRADMSVRYLLQHVFDKMLTNEAGLKKKYR